MDDPHIDSPSEAVAREIVIALLYDLPTERRLKVWKAIAAAIDQQVHEATGWE
jgi:hypothetical protein